MACCIVSLGKWQVALPFSTSPHNHRTALCCWLCGLYCKRVVFNPLWQEFDDAWKRIWRFHFHFLSAGWTMVGVVGSNLCSKKPKLQRKKKQTNITHCRKLIPYTYTNTNTHTHLLSTTASCNFPVSVFTFPTAALNTGSSSFKNFFFLYTLLEATRHRQAKQCGHKTIWEIGWFSRLLLVCAVAMLIFKGQLQWSGKWCIVCVMRLPN